MTTPPLSDFSESPEKITKLNLPPKPVLTTSLPLIDEPPPLPITSSEGIEKILEPCIKHSSHHCTSIFLSFLVILSALIALGVQVSIFFQHHTLGSL